MYKDVFDYSSSIFYIVYDAMHPTRSEERNSLLNLYRQVMSGGLILIRAVREGLGLAHRYSHLSIIVHSSIFFLRI